MKRFIKNHKILSFILLVVLVTILSVALFIYAKLSKISYHDGTIEEEIAIENVEIIEDEEVQSSDQAEEVIEHSEMISADELAQLDEMEVILSYDVTVVDEDVFNILLLGTDERTAEFSANARADSIMLLSLDKKDNTMKLVSLQRGMGVPVLEGQYKDQYDWITHIFRYGGADLMLKTVREMFNVDVEYYVRVNFNTFTQLIDSVGGVDIELTELEAQGLNGEVKTNARAKHMMYAGMNHLDGYDALQYSRLRYTDSDWQRVQRQRNVIHEVMVKAKNMGILELNNSLDTVLPLIQTNLGKTDLLGLVSYFPAVLGGEFEQMTIPASGTYGSMKGMGNRTLYAVDFKTNSKILSEFLYGREEDE